MAMPRHPGIVIIGNKTLKNMLGKDIIRQLKATMEGIGIGEEKERKKEDEFGKVEKREFLRGRSVGVS